MFRDRAQAGRLLGDRLKRLDLSSPIVVGLPRGGVAVAAQAARLLEAPLDVIVVRKLGIPFQPEVAMGAVGERDVRLVDWVLVSMAGISASQVRDVMEREIREVRRRSARYRGGRAPLDLSGRDVVIVDDGIATGSTALAAVRVARDLGAARVVVAAPVAPREVVSRLRQEADEVVVLQPLEPLRAVGQAYVEFDQVGDTEVAAILRAAKRSEQEDPIAPQSPAARSTL